MKCHSLIISGFALVLMISMCQAQTERRWDFSRTGDRENWTVPASARGVVMGGSLWLTLEPKETDPEKMARTAYQAFGDMKEKVDLNLASSPPGLEIAAADATQVRMRVLNLSSLTHYYLRRRTIEQGWGGEARDWLQPRQFRRCTLKADLKKWQEITCYPEFPF